MERAGEQQHACCSSILGEQKPKQSRVRDLKLLYLFVFNNNNNKKVQAKRRRGSPRPSCVIRHTRRLVVLFYNLQTWGKTEERQRTRTLVLRHVEQFAQQLFVFFLHKAPLDSQPRVGKILAHVILHPLCPNPLMPFGHKPVCVGWEDE